jgi:hypothetical protein
MTIERKRLIGIGAAILVAVAGGGAALAASGHHDAAGPSRPGGGLGVGVPPPGYGFGGGRPRGDRLGPGGDLRTASTYLGVSVQTLLSDLRSGRTLAQVADSTAGKTSAGLVAALVAAERSRIEQDVSAGRLTRAQADGIESGLRTRIEARVNGRPGSRGDGSGRPGDDRHGPGRGEGDDDDGRAPAPRTTVPSTHI